MRTHKAASGKLNRVERLSGTGNFWKQAMAIENLLPGFALWTCMTKPVAVRHFTLRHFSLKVVVLYPLGSPQLVIEIPENDTHCGFINKGNKREREKIPNTFIYLTAAAILVKCMVSKGAVFIQVLQCVRSVGLILAHVLCSHRR